jgi:predicted DNA-binding transcriptional regulator AlpA
MGVPAYVSRKRLAEELDICETTVDEMVRRGVIPRPLPLSTGCIRWCWADVETALASLKPVQGAAVAPGDPYIQGARNVRQITEGRRDAS